MENHDIPMEAFKKLHEALNEMLETHKLTASDAMRALVYLNAEFISNICACNDVSVDRIYATLEESLKEIIFSDEMDAAIADKKQQLAEEND